MTATATDHGAAHIGPNAIVQIAEALRHALGSAAARTVFGSAGLTHHLRHPPERMVPEHEVRRLHGALRHELGAADAARIAADAGRRTGDYLLAHRIPRPVQAVLRRLPAGLAARLLLRAVTRHAWTFAGSGRFQARAGHPVVLEIRDNPLCRDLRTEEPACAFYAATFERLFRVLVHPGARVRETACEARGDDACRFEIRWGDALTPHMVDPLSR